MRERSRRGGGIVAVLMVALTAGCASRAAPAAAGTNTSPPRGLAGSPSGPITPGPIHTPSPGIESIPPAPTAPVGCHSTDVSLAPDWQQQVAYVCLQHQARLLLHLPTYPSGWSPLTIAPAGAAVIHTTAPARDGSADATVTATRPGSFTLDTYTRDDLAPTYDWTIHVVVRP